MTVHDRRSERGEHGGRVGFAVRRREVIRTEIRMNSLMGESWRLQRYVCLLYLFRCFFSAHPYMVLFCLRQSVVPK